MPAPVLIVHQETDTCEMLLAALRTAGYEAAGFDDPLKALGALEVDSRVCVLVAQLDLGPGKLSGLALARMLRYRKSSVAVIFIGRPEKDRLIDGLGEFVPHLSDVQVVVDAVGRLLNAGGDKADKRHCGPSHRAFGSCVKE